MRYGSHSLYEGMCHADPFLAILRCFLLGGFEAVVEDCLPEGLVPPSFAEVLVASCMAYISFGAMAFVDDEPNFR